MTIELTNLLHWAVLPTSEAPADLLEEPEVQEFMQSIAPADTDELEAAVRSISDKLPALHDPAKGCVLALCCGALVEEDANPESGFSGLLEFFNHLQQSADNEQPVPPDAWRYTTMALMAMLCRSAHNRRQFQQQPQLANWLDEHEELSDHLHYLLTLHQTTDEDQLLVLFPAYKTGLEVSISQVMSVFHLLTLLQPLVLEQASALGLQRAYAPINPELIRYASGHATTEPPETDHARFEWLNAAAYQGGPLDSLMLAWGEAPVRALPRVRGQVVLLATENEKRLSRSWDAGFLTVVHDAHRPLVQLRRALSTAEVHALLNELHPPVAATPLPKRRPWWQRFFGRG